MKFLVKYEVWRVYDLKSFIIYGLSNTFFIISYDPLTLHAQDRSATIGTLLMQSIMKKQQNQEEYLYPF